MILITRPLAQSENLQSLLNGLEIDYELFPAFEINKINTKTSRQQYDVIIFISTNAVMYAEEYFKKLFIKPFKIFAVGPVTAKILKGLMNRFLKYSSAYITALVLIKIMTSYCCREVFVLILLISKAGKSS
jgi:uroporphyrinogen-III synthase